MQYIYSWSPHSSVFVIIASTTLPPLYSTPLVEILSIQGGLFNYQFLSHPISRAPPIDYPPTLSSEPIVPFLLGIFIISQLSSDQTVYSLVLRRRHSLHSSSNQQRDYITSQKMFFRYQSLYHPISRAKPTVYPPTPSSEHIVHFLLVKIIISKFSSNKTVYPLIL